MWNNIWYQHSVFISFVWLQDKIVSHLVLRNETTTFELNLAFFCRDLRLRNWLVPISIKLNYSIRTPFIAPLHGKKMNIIQINAILNDSWQLWLGGVQAMLDWFGCSAAKRFQFTRQLTQHANSTKMGHTVVIHQRSLYVLLHPQLDSQPYQSSLAAAGKATTFSHSLRHVNQQATGAEPSQQTWPYVIKASTKATVPVPHSLL